MSSAPVHYTQLCKHLAEVGTVTSISHLLNWDQETYMPPAAAGQRAEQIALISTLAHEKSTSRELGDLIGKCEQDRTLTAVAISPEARNIREVRDFDHATKLPTDLVADLARTGSQAQEVWKDARARNDFAMFEPWLEKMMSLARRKAEYLGGGGPSGELYDALLDQYEPGVTARQIEAIFTPLAARLGALVKEVNALGKRPSDAPLHVAIPAAQQHEIGQFVLRAMGFDFEAGRLDTTTHPFCSGIAAGDTRLTTRYREEHWNDALYGTMHEGGHGLYEQGLPKKPPLLGTPLASSISLGIHESQSRMWENFVGRGQEFWQWLLPHAQKMTRDASGRSPLDIFTADQLYAAVNTATPSLIRVESDEATYNLHILIRFNIERGLISGSLKVRDLPGEWNRAYKQHLGVDVPDDRRGCLQDVHWAFGLVGYFPTYTLGNLYCAQLWETINEKIPDLTARMSRGEFGELRQWLGTNIHAHGKRYRAGELCEMLTGKPLTADSLLRHLERKLRPLYK